MANGEIWIADPANFEASKHRIVQRTVTAGVIGPGTNWPLFSDDGQWIVFGRTVDGEECIFKLKSDGTGTPELVTRNARAPEGWLPHSDTFSYINDKNRNDYDIWSVSLAEKQPRPLAAVPGSAQLASQYSPNGHWVAWQSNETAPGTGGDFQVYVAPWPLTGVRYQVSTQGGRLPMWSSDHELQYEDSRAGAIVAISFKPGSPPRFGKPVPLPIDGYFQRNIRRNYDLTPSGRYIMVFAPAPTLELISNWQR